LQNLELQKYATVWVEIVKDGLAHKKVVNKKNRLIAQTV
jgi:hypothetical protein